MIADKPYWIVVRDDSHKTEQFSFDSLESAELFWKEKTSERSWKFGTEAKIMLAKGRELKTINIFRRRFGLWRTIK